MTVLSEMWWKWCNINYGMKSFKFMANISNLTVNKTTDFHNYYLKKLYVVFIIFIIPYRYDPYSFSSADL